MFVVEIRRGIRQRQGPLRVTFMTPDRPPTKQRRQNFMIDQCFLTWPTFGITKTIFEGWFFLLHLLFEKTHSYYFQVEPTP